MQKCDWCLGNPLYETYHDTQWGVPVYDSQLLFQHFCLESFQAGLSWITILKKRENFYQAFDNFNPHIVAYYDDNKVNDLVNDTGIIRHRGKILATIKNAQCYLEQAKTISFSDYLWEFVGGKPIQNHFNTLSQLPSQTPLSLKISKDFKKHGFKFCGATMVYAFMQATGMVNDHLTTCFLYENTNK
jgi:DNA-3-methyladenine glycosylase I